MTKLNRRHLLAAAAASLALPARASAFPTHAVTVVVPYPTSTCASSRRPPRARWASRW